MLRGEGTGIDATGREILARVADRPHRVVVNGVDRPGVRDAAWPAALFTSALTGEGIPALAEALAHDVGGVEGGAGLQLASERQADLLLQVAAACAEAIDGLPMAGPAVAAEGVVDALAALDDLTGAGAREAVLDALFARFCIGK